MSDPLGHVEAEREAATGIAIEAGVLQAIPNREGLCSGWLPAVT
jgi:hypothetical protein